MGYSLDQIVSEYIIESGLTDSQRARLYQFGLSGLRHFDLDTSGIIKIKELQIQPNDTAVLPVDFIALSRIAVGAEDGILYALSVNSSLNINKRYDDCGNVLIGARAGDVLDGAIISPYPADNYRNGELMGRMFGIGGTSGQLGEYRIDQASGVITFRGLLQTSNIILEYIGDINADDEDFYVHPYCVEALKDWIQWRYKKFSSKPLGEQQTAKNDYALSYRNMQVRFMQGTKQDWLDVFRSGDLRTAKF